MIVLSQLCPNLGAYRNWNWIYGRRWMKRMQLTGDHQHLAQLTELILINKEQGFGTILNLLNNLGTGSKLEKLEIEGGRIDRADAENIEIFKQLANLKRLKLDNIEILPSEIFGKLPRGRKCVLTRCLTEGNLSESFLNLVENWQSL